MRCVDEESVGEEVLLVRSASGDATSLACSPTMKLIVKGRKKI